MFGRYRGYSSYVGQLDVSGNEMTGILVPEKEPQEVKSSAENAYIKDVEDDINKFVINTYIQGVKKHCLMKEYGRNVMVIKGYIDNECYRSVNRILNSGLASLSGEVEYIWKNVQSKIEADKSIEKSVKPETERGKKALEELLVLITKQVVGLIKDGYDTNRISHIISTYKYEIIRYLMILYKG
jgi:hypothetical protein